MRLTSSLALMAIACTTLACGDDVPAGAALGIIEHYGDAALIDAPVEAVVGEQVLIDLQTVGGGCVGYHSTEVTVSAMAAHIRPIDTQPESDAVCTADMRLLDHSVGVVFNESGTAWVRIDGRRVNSDLDEEDTWTLAIDVQHSRGE